MQNTPHVMNFTLLQIATQWFLHLQSLVAVTALFGTFHLSVLSKPLSTFQPQQTPIYFLSLWFCFFRTLHINVVFTQILCV